MKALIVGAGIGGLAAALALDRIGWQVQVLERAVALKELGAGVQISPNGTRLLDLWGVTERLVDSIFEPEAIELRLGRSGRRIFNLPMRYIAQARWGAGYFQVHRADLQAALRDTLLSRQPGALRLGAEVSGYVQDSAGLRVLLRDGATQPADLVIGADGIRSVIRGQMLGPDAPRFTGHVAWRALVPTERLGSDAPPPTGCIWAEAGRHAVTTRVRGGSLVNFVGIVAQQDWRHEGWSLRGNADEVLRDFGDFHPSVRRIPEAADEIFRWALFDRAPLDRWADGAVALLGDAAHPMLPSMAQGAVQALEDAHVLAQQLSRTSDVAAACRAYFDARRDRTRRVQAMSAANLTIFHRQNPLMRYAGFGAAWAAGQIAPGLLHRRQDWLYGARFD